MRCVYYLLCQWNFHLDHSECVCVCVCVAAFECFVHCLGNGNIGTKSFLLLLLLSLSLSPFHFVRFCSFCHRFAIFPLHQIAPCDPQTISLNWARNFSYGHRKRIFFATLQLNEWWLLLMTCRHSLFTFHYGARWWIDMLRFIAGSIVPRSPILYQFSITNMSINEQVASSYNSILTTSANGCDAATTNEKGMKWYYTDLIEENPLRLLMQLNSDARLPMMSEIKHEDGLLQWDWPSPNEKQQQ